MLGLKRAFLGFFGFLSASLSLSSAASAVVLQPTPGGMPVPVINAGVTSCTDKNVEICIDQSEGDPALIDAQADALVAPETFQPTCQLTFTPIVKGGAISDVFGWYNVKPDPANPGKFLKPTQAELYGMFYATGFKTKADFSNAQVVLDLGVEAAAGRYKGGQIGFFLVATDGAISINPTTHAVIGDAKFQFFTQHALNAGSTAAQTFYNVLTWESVAQKNTFYFGWEDLPPNTAIDNDFDDFLFSVSGVQCGGGGQPCDTGMLGVCAAGVLQCKKSVITCVPTLASTSETCNALDDDCNGAVDDGDGLCGADEVCNRGVCVPRCGTGEFRCPEGSVCSTGGVCVDPACKDMECPAGKVCAVGECVDSCTGIICPHGRACRNGGCVDPCVGIECDDGFACVDGICTSCDCSACADGEVCHEAPATPGVKLCLDSGCENQTCAGKTHCAAGACVDDCDGATCPAGQLCSSGECVADPNGPVGSGGSGSGATGGIVIITGGANGFGATGAGGKSNGGSGKPVTTDQKACNCTVPGGKSSGLGALLLAALFGVLRRGRRRAA
jgi:MYXO-CTERM domain-containing protein